MRTVESVNCFETFLRVQIYKFRYRMLIESGINTLNKWAPAGMAEQPRR